MQLHLALAVRAVAPVGTAAWQFECEGVVANVGAEPAMVDLVELASQSLALEIVDGNGAPVRMPPPPTPGRPDEFVLAPGERRSIALRAIVPAAVMSGGYRARLRYRDARSEWVDLALR